METQTNETTSFKEVNATDKMEYQINKYAKLATCWELDNINDIVVHKVFIPAQGETFKIFYDKLVLSKKFIWKNNDNIANTEEEKDFCFNSLDHAFQTYKNFINTWPNWKDNKEYWKYIDNNK